MEGWGEGLEGVVVGDKPSLVEEPHRRDVDILGWAVEGGFIRVEFSGVVPRDRKSGEYVNLGMGHSLVKGYHWS